MVVERKAEARKTAKEKNIMADLRLIYAFMP